MDNWLVVGAGFTILVLAVGHWAPWEPPLFLLGRYVYGVSAILGGYAIWRLPANDWITPAALLLLSIVGGATVWGCYRIDALVLAIRKAKRAECDDELA